MARAAPARSPRGAWSLSGTDAETAASGTESGSDLDAGAATPGRRAALCRWGVRRAGTFAATAAALALCGGAAAAAHRGRRPQGPPPAEAGSSVELSTATEVVEGAVVAAELFRDARKTYPHLKEMYETGSEMYHEFKGDKNDSSGAASLVDGDTEGSPTFVDNQTDDSNLCAEDEEAFMDLCYKKCSLLTNNDYPIRTTPWSCCRMKPCSVFNQKVELKICGGFNTAGDVEGNGCPHAIGTCLEDEELHLGMCYKKCSLLTENEFPYRRAVATCCKVDSLIGCMNFENVKTSSSFAVGGGQREGGTLRGRRRVHLPVPKLARQGQHPQEVEEIETWGQMAEDSGYQMKMQRM